MPTSSLIFAAGLRRLTGLLLLLLALPGWARPGTRPAAIATAPPLGPRVTGFSPASAAVGSTIILNGQDLADMNSITFSGTSNNVVTSGFTVSPDGTQITGVVVPSGAITGRIVFFSSSGPGTSTVDFIVTVPQTLVVSTSGVSVAAGTYAGITVQNGGSATLAGPVAVISAVTVQSGGTLSTGCQPLTGAASFTVAAGGTLAICDPAGISSSGTTGAVQTTGARSFSPDASYTYNGTQAQVTGPGLPASVRTLTLGNSAGLSLSGPLTATTAVVLGSGVLRTGANALTLGASATLSEKAAAYVTGTVQTTRPLATAGATESFGGLGLTLTPGGSILPGSTLVRRVTGTARTGRNNSQSVLRSYDIQPTTNAGLSVALALAVRSDELNGIAAANLRLYKSEDSGATWQQQKAATVAFAAASGNQPATYTANLTGVRSFSVWTMGNAAAPLPVELADFRAEAQGPGALLRWTTASEQASAAFEVEASSDGVGFARVGTVAAAGTSSQARSYTFTDPQLARYGAPRVYYRLRQLDQDGTASYSPVRLVAVAGTGAPTLALYPNPAVPGQPLAYAYTGAALPAGAVLELYDATGRRLATQPAASNGQLEAAGLAPGWYWVRLRGTATTTRFYQP